MSDFSEAPYGPSTCVQHFHKMPLDVVRLQQSSLWMEAEDDPWLGYAAMNIWISAWMNVPTGSIDFNDRLIHKRARVPKDQWIRIADRIREGFETYSDGRQYHPVLVEMAIRALEASQKQRDRANKRWKKDETQTAAIPENVRGNATAQETDATALKSAFRGIENGCRGNARNGTERNLTEHSKVDSSDRSTATNHLGVSKSDVAQIFDFGAKTPAPTKPKVDPALIEKAWSAFWKRYPSRAPASNPSVPAKDKFTKLMKAAPDAVAWADEVIAAVDVFARIEKDAGTEGRNIAQTVTWLNQKRWTDYRDMPKLRDDGMC